MLICVQCINPATYQRLSNRTCQALMTKGKITVDTASFMHISLPCYVASPSTSSFPSNRRGGLYQLLATNHIFIHHHVSYRLVVLILNEMDPTCIFKAVQDPSLRLCPDASPQGMSNPHHHQHASVPALPQTQTNSF